MHFNRSLARGLKILAALNAHGPATVASLARHAELPRTTAFRLLCTLMEEGYVHRDPVTETFHPTECVVGLAAGFDETARLVDLARPLVTQLGAELVWPIKLATLAPGAIAGARAPAPAPALLLRLTTDHASPLAVFREEPGSCLPLLERAAGLVLLAVADARQRALLLDALYTDGARDQPPAARATVESWLEQARQQGFATVTRPGRHSDHVSLAVPVEAGGISAALGVSFARTAVTPEVESARFLPALKRTARAIAEQHARALRAPLPAARTRPAGRLELQRAARPAAVRAGGAGGARAES
jgi:IclR family mhp operon transcriptional activator